MKRPNKKKHALAPSSDSPQKETRFVSYEGPLPPSGEMDRYEVILPGAAERLFTMAEDEQKNRHFMERVGLVGGFLVWFVLLAAAVVLAYLGARTAAAVVGSGVGLMMLDRFISRRNK